MVSIILRDGPCEPRRRIDAFADSPVVREIVVLAARAAEVGEKVRLIRAERPEGGRVWDEALATPRSDYVLLVDGTNEIRLGPLALERLVDVAEQTGAGMVYAGHGIIDDDGSPIRQPLIDYQLGSLRDEFAFGPLQLLSLRAIRQAADRHGPLADTRWSAFYDLRLRVSTDHAVLRLPELLYDVLENTPASSEASHFAYVAPESGPLQHEREAVVTDHLRRIGAWLPPRFEPVPASSETFPVEASVVIPVRNRERTIADAVGSAAGQQTTFSFNVMVVDNHSTDGTTGILRDLARQNSRIVHVVPSRTDLGIGGCWNEAVRSTSCGRFAVQLDSDDLYADATALERMVTELRRGPYAMVVGAYRVVDFDLNELPPGIVDHREWTRDNGRNNALRVNGFGAPRAFMTSLLRRHPLPNVSYGEDYAIGLRLSRSYEIGRIFEPIYLCRRWPGNSDAGLSLATANEYNTYKDRLRTIEVLARQAMNRQTGR